MQMISLSPAFLTLSVSALLVAAVPAFSVVLCYRAEWPTIDETIANENNLADEIDCGSCRSFGAFASTLTYRCLTGSENTAHFHAPAANQNVAVAEAPARPKGTLIQWASAIRAHDAFNVQRRTTAIHDLIASETHPRP